MLNCEHLESRDTPAVLSFDAAAGAMMAAGGDGNDIVRVYEVGSDYQLVSYGLGGVVIDSLTVPQSAARTVYFFGGAGNDIFANYSTTLASVALGGDGDDYLRGDDAADVLIGGAGSDHLHGGRGNDYLDGGAGADLLYGGLDFDLFASDDEDAIHDY